MEAEPPAEAASDWTIEQNWAQYTAAEHALWDKLFARQVGLLAGRAHPAFLKGLDILGDGGVPHFEHLSDRLEKLTGWRVVAVPGLVPDAVFHHHLANRRFVAGNFLRRPDQIDYLQEPDVFHDVFGHVPLLSDPVFADYMQAYGQGGMRASGLGSLDRLARLYWYTVEFGLIDTPEGRRIYGAGIVSSAAESHFALESPSPNHLGFDLMRVMRTRYRIDDFQQSYFVIPSFEKLLGDTLDSDFGPLYTALDSLDELPPEAVLPEDHVLQKGTQAHAGG